MNVKIVFPLIAIVLVLFISQGFYNETQVEPWPVPAKYANMENPVNGSLDLGKEMYNLHCKSCHGKEGLGDGSKAEQLDTPAGDFTDEDFQSQSDGALFYKTLTGRDDMPSFEKKMTQEEIWASVNYMRTFE